MIIHGRSDATLNPGGVRIGTAEIYRQVEQLDGGARRRSCIGQDWDDDVRVVLFVITAKPGVELEQGWSQDTIKAAIRNGASPRHVPARIVRGRRHPAHQVGQDHELAVREVVHGRPVKNQEALANPRRSRCLPIAPNSLAESRRTDTLCARSLVGSRSCRGQPVRDSRRRAAEAALSIRSARSPFKRIRNRRSARAACVCFPRQPAVAAYLRRWRTSGA